MSPNLETAPIHQQADVRQPSQDIGAAYVTAAYFPRQSGLSAQELADQYRATGLTPADSLPNVGGDATYLADTPSPSGIYEALVREAEAAAETTWATDHLVQSYRETGLTPADNLPEVGATPEPPVLPDYRVIFSLSEAVAAGKLRQSETNNSSQVHISTQRQDPRLHATTYDRRPGVSWQDVETETGERIPVAQIQAGMALAPIHDVNYLLRVRDSLVRSREWDLRDDIPQTEAPQTTSFDVSPQQRSIVTPSHDIAEITPEVEEMRVEIAQEAIDIDPTGVCRMLFKALGLKMGLRRNKLGRVERDNKGRAQREVIDSTGTAVTESFALPPKPTLRSEKSEIEAHDNAVRSVIGRVAAKFSELVTIRARKLPPIDPRAHELLLGRILSQAK